MNDKEVEYWATEMTDAELHALESDAQQIYEVLLKMLDRWNAHDIGAQ